MKFFLTERIHATVPAWLTKRVIACQCQKPWRPSRPIIELSNAHLERQITECSLPIIPWKIYVNWHVRSWCAPRNFWRALFEISTLLSHIVEESILQVSNAFITRQKTFGVTQIDQHVNLVKTSKKAPPNTYSMQFYDTWIHSNPFFEKITRWNFF